MNPKMGNGLWAWGVVGAIGLTGHWSCLWAVKLPGQAQTLELILNAMANVLTIVSMFKLNGLDGAVGV